MRRSLSLFALILLPPSLALAHDLGAECKLKDGVIQVNAFFEDDTPAVHAKVEVTDMLGNAIAAGKTDARGFWSFSAPPAGDYVVIVDGGMGHRARVPLVVPWNLPVVAASSAGASAGPLGPYLSWALVVGKKVPSIAPESVSEGGVTVSPVTRGEFTRFPYLKVGLGLGAILIFSLAFFAARSRCCKRNAPPG